MDSTRNEETTPVVRKESKNRIRVDYEGKLSISDRLKSKVKAANTWIKFVVVVFRFIMMLGVSFVILHPFVEMIAKSFMSEGDITKDPTVSLIPKNPTLDIYLDVIVGNNYFTALVNTFVLCLLCAVIQTMISCLVGYGLAKFKFKGNKLIMALVILTMVIPHGVLEISMMQHFTFFDLMTVQSWNYPGIIELLTGSTIELYNTYSPLIILSVFGLAFKNGLYIYLLRQFFKGVPDELEESAYVDGSGVFRTFFQIILPLTIPMLVTVFLFSFSWQWTDEFYTTIFFSTDQNKIYLMKDVWAPIGDLAAKYVVGDYKNAFYGTGAIMIVAPLIVLYLFGQKYLVQGIERSGLVG